MAFTTSVQESQGEKRDMPSNHKVYWHWYEYCPSVWPEYDVKPLAQPRVTGAYNFHPVLHVHVIK